MGAANCEAMFALSTKDLSNVNNEIVITN